jgi:hypothetical protein
VRSGDFIVALLRDAKDIDGYAFALGALSHYAADNDGHLIGVNRAVPMLYPKLQKKYGDVVTYEESPLAHVKTEFGFDVLEVAQGRYAPENYHDFIGFGVSAPLLEQAFQETYSLDLKSVLPNEGKALGSYRHTVSQLLPKATRIAWSLKKDQITKDQPGITKNKFLFNLSRASYQKNWGHEYQQPTFWENCVAFFTKNAQDTVHCWFSSEFKDPSIDPKFKLCSYSCSDGTASVWVVHIGLPCPPTPDRLPQ